MKYIYTTILLCFLNISLLGQSRITVNEASEAMTEDVYFLTIFVETRADIWEVEEMEYIHDEFESSLDWLSEQADRYNQEVDFNTDFFYLDNEETIYIDAITREDNPQSIVRTMVEKIGYRSFNDFLKNKRFEEKPGKLKILLFVKDSGRSHAYDNYGVSDVDIAVIYWNNSYGTITDEYVISHEILHHFGAWDLYYGERQTKTSARKAMELYANSVMINTYKNKHLLEIDELTAWRIGWGDYKTEYDYFDPQKLKAAKTQEEAFTPRKPKNEQFSIKFDLGKKKKKKN